MSFLKFNTKLFKYKTEYLFVYIKDSFYSSMSRCYQTSGEKNIPHVHFVDINKKNTEKVCSNRQLRGSIHSNKRITRFLTVC